MSEADPYRAGPCPICGQFATGTYRHIGAPRFCKNGHRWGGSCGHGGQCANTPVPQVSEADIGMDHGSDDIHKEFVGRIGGPHDGYTVYLVDGEDTRLRVNNDLTGGGNDQAYPGDDPEGQSPNREVPKGELWIERGDPRSYLPYLMHELIEALRMRYAHEEYKVAHLWASQAEALVRRMQRGGAPAGNVDTASVLAYKAVRGVLSARRRDLGA